MSLKNISIPTLENAAVAVSGGSDSLALTLLLRDSIKDLTALIVDHQVRPESALEAQSVHKQLTGHGIKVQILTLDKSSLYTKNGTTLKGNIQKRARSKRYDILHHWCLENKCKDLFLGHHQGDQEETQLMRLRQNSGLLGMGGIRDKAHFKGINLHRPFLNLSKCDLQNYLHMKNMSWVTDPSNKNEKFERVFWRIYLNENSFPLDKSIDFQKVRQGFEGWVTRFLTEHALQSPLGYLALDYPSFLKLPLEFQCILLSYIFVIYGVGDHPPSSNAILQLIENLSSKQVFPQTLKGCRISLKQKKIVVAREYKLVKKQREKMGMLRLFDQRFLCSGVENTCDYTLHPMGDDNWKNVLEQNPFLKNVKTPRYALWSLPILKKNTEIYLPSCLLDEQENHTFKTFFCTFIGKSPF